MSAFPQRPNQALEPTTLAVTPRAPSSTSRASQGRGSSLTLAEECMSAVFNAATSFSLPSRRWFVISGDIASGVVKKGMTMHVRMNSSLALTLPIAAVEIVTKEGRSEVALCTPYRDDNELSMLQSLNIGGEEIQIDGSAMDEERG